MRSVDKIEYVCIKKPNIPKLEGFEVRGIYKGRTFNDLYEISIEWASHKPTLLIDKKTFDQFFKMVEKPQATPVASQNLPLEQ